MLSFIALYRTDGVEREARQHCLYYSLFHTQWIPFPRASTIITLSRFLRRGRGTVSMVSGGWVGWLLAVGMILHPMQLSVGRYCR